MRVRRGFTLVELMIVIGIMGILASVAVPNFVRFQTRSKQAEPKANLRAIYTAQLSYSHEKDLFTPYVTELGFTPERANRYAYRLTTTGSVEPRSAVAPAAGTYTGIGVDTHKWDTQILDPAFVASALVAGPSTAAKVFYATAAGQLDTDARMDSWYISTETGTDVAACGSNTTKSVRGVAFQTFDDTNCQ